LTKSKLSSVVIAILVVITGFLANAVMDKITRTTVTAQNIAPQLAIPTPESEPADNDAALVVFIGDFTQGSDEGGDGPKNWVSLLAAEVRKVAPLRTAVDDNGEGSGYAIRASSPTLGEEVRRLVASETRMVVLSGSRNDVVAQPNEVFAAAQEAYHAISELAPHAQLIVIGPTWGSGAPSADILQTRDAVRDAAATAHAHFIDPIGDDWFTDGEPGLIGSDSVHPTDLGNQRIAQYLYPLFVQLMSEHA
jgi:hypothetical protein